MEKLEGVLSTFGTWRQETGEFLKTFLSEARSEYPRNLKFREHISLEIGEEGISNTFKSINNH